MATQGSTAGMRDSDLLLGIMNNTAQILRAMAPSETASQSNSYTDSSESRDATTSSDSETSGSEAETKKKKSRRSKKKRHDAKGKARHDSRMPKKPAKVQADSDLSSDSDVETGSISDDESQASASDTHQEDSRRRGLPPPAQAQLHHQPPMPQTFGTYPSYQQFGYYALPTLGMPTGPTGGIVPPPGLAGLYAPPPVPLPPIAGSGRGNARRETHGRAGRAPLGLADGHRHSHGAGSSHKAKSKSFKRVDQVWDQYAHNYKLQPTAEEAPVAEYEGYAFHVRRTFDWNGKYKRTMVDIKSKTLRDALQAAMGEIKGISLVEDVPKLDPNILFLYLPELRQYAKTLKKLEPTGDKKSRKKEAKRIATQREQIKVLIKYLEEDYDDVKKSLYPLLENGLITFDLLWALWKPNTLAFTTEYGSPDLPRVFEVDTTEKLRDIMRNERYVIEGRYFEYDGKRFGHGDIVERIESFKGTRKITSLPVYPLQYHRNEEQLRKQLIERGKMFVALSGVQYRCYDGMAYYKKKDAIVKVHISGRIMIDANIHRRINPNYALCQVEDSDDEAQLGDEFLSGDEEQSDKGGDAAIPCEQSDAGSEGIEVRPDDQSEVAREDGRVLKSVAEVANGVNGDKTDDDEKKLPEFSDDEYLTASPLVLGFAFSEKLWLEFTVASVKEIQWNQSAYDSLVLEPKTKDIVKALVESHKYHAAESIDDVIQGKGKGLVAVLHGPPGTGKTLTAEGISELLKCPLYMVTAGELGTNSRLLETELQKILDICHAWGAILLLDEADVFLEKRNMSDIHRNALVSVFLRQLEYFQGILFLTTNRVETFDDAFQSRIHIALRYNSLDSRAREAIFKMFIARVAMLDNMEIVPFSAADYSALGRHDLNGRQIKNTVRTAQALAVNRGEALSMAHIRQVLEVHMSFDRDLKGGPGFQDAMRSYF